MNPQQVQALLQRFSRIAIGIGLGVSAVQSALFTVDAGERAIIFQRYGGVQEKIVPPGTHLFVPIFQRPIVYDVRTQYKNIQTHTGSKDLQNVSVALRILFRPDVSKLPQIYQELNVDYDERVLPSIGNEILKAVVARYNAAELITQRATVSSIIRQRLTERAAEFNIVLDDVAVTHLSFSDEYTAAIEQKQVAQQRAETAKYEVLRKEQEKIASVIRAEGESEAARLISEAMASSSGFLELRRIEARREIAETLSKSPVVSYLPSSGSNVLLNLGR